jgi:hypothetical protein
VTTATIVDELASSSVLRPAGLGVDLLPGVEIEMGDELGAGGFGTVYACASIGGRPDPGLVVKRHRVNGAITDQDTADVLMALMEAVDARWSGSPDAARQALPAVPFWVGRAHWGGVVAVISIARDLGIEGMTGYADILDDAVRFTSWLDVDVADRTAAAHHLVQGQAVIEDLGVLHADINVENLFVDPTGGRAALIDWDAGYVPGGPHPGPLSWGKPDDFVAPELKRGGTVDPSAISLLTERWAVGCTVHYLLFGVGPLFFLDRLTEDSVSAYLEDHDWPDIDVASPLFNRPNRVFYLRFLDDLAAMPPSVVELFRRLVEAAASDPARRPSAAEWRDALAVASCPPEIAWATVSRTTTVAGRPVRVAWDAPEATEVWVDGRGPFPRSGWAEVDIAVTRTVVVSATNAFGSVATSLGPIEVVTAPPVPSFVVPPPDARLPDAVPGLPDGLPLPSSPTADPCLPDPVPDIGVLELPPPVVATVRVGAAPDLMRARPISSSPWARLRRLRAPGREVFIPWS